MQYPSLPQAEIQFLGQYYDGQTSRPHRVQVRLRNQSLSVLFLEQERALLHFSPDQVRLGSRLGNTTRSLELPDGRKVETEDNDAVDRIAQAWGYSSLRPHLFESSLKIALSAIVLLGALSAAAFIWGVPFFAKKLAYAIPDDVAYRLGEGTLSALDKMMFEPSELLPERKQELREGFKRMAVEYPRLPLRLEFRKAKMANAFALPNGTVVITDELVEVVERDEEIYAVLAHEMGHVEHRHTARMALESSAIGVLIMVVLGDASQAAGIAGALPAIYANATFSRSHETEADTFALDYMKRTGLDPQAFADALQHMTKDESGRGPSVLEYMSSHPATDERMARFRK